MAIYDSFVFTGHGRNNTTGAIDPGSISEDGNVTEHSLNVLIVEAAKRYLDKTPLSILYGVNNYSNDILGSHTIKAKAGIEVHINATTGATGTEIIAPLAEQDISQDLVLVADIANKLSIPNRGVKGRLASTGAFVTKTNGQVSSGTNYYKVTTVAWNRGTSLSILETGFIGNDLSKIQANIDYIGWAVCKYVCSLCGVSCPVWGNTTTTPVQPTTPQPTTPTTPSWTETAENGRFTPNTTINFRNKPIVNATQAPIQGQYHKNEVVFYDRIVKGNGYVWVSWMSANKVRRYMPIRTYSINTTTKKEVFGPMWGSIK